MDTNSLVNINCTLGYNELALEVSSSMIQNERQKRSKGHVQGKRCASMQTMLDDK